MALASVRRQTSACAHEEYISFPGLLTFRWPSLPWLVFCTRIAVQDDAAGTVRESRPKVPQGRKTELQAALTCLYGMQCNYC